MLDGCIVVYDFQILGDFKKVFLFYDVILLMFLKVYVMFGLVDVFLFFVNVILLDFMCEVNKIVDLDCQGVEEVGVYFWWNINFVVLVVLKMIE